MTRLLLITAAAFAIAALLLGYADQGLLCFACVGMAAILAGMGFDNYENDHM